MRKWRAIAAAGSASLVAIALMLAPASAEPGQRKGSRPTASLNGRPVGAFTPAVSDPRLNSEFRFTPATASTERSNAVRVAIRGRTNNPAEVPRTAIVPPNAPVTAITPSSYNLGVSLGWRRFAVPGHVAQAKGGSVPVRRESAQVGMSNRASRG